MIEIIRSPYGKIVDKIAKPIDLSMLPLYGEKEILNLSVGRYGKVKIKLEVESDLHALNVVNEYKERYKENKNYHTYQWEVEENKLPKQYEYLIRSEMTRFIEIFSVLNKDPHVFRFSIVDGGFRDLERPVHAQAVREAIIELFNQI
ncbi:hypothetical protein [Flavobacterium gelatinilyticum]|uniref:hypothetical protein n=1 Tax=Flavobacterium gelatinilyticum TaxID=3003260 RepID=UPI00247FF4F8|nr:hypothetical protein [Flavobacterium gelatinilyticum]